MPTSRHATVDPTCSGVYLCRSRCVRRAFLCGRDRYSGRNYEHRRAWVRNRLRELVGFFAVEVHAYAVMSNHLHAVLRTQPESVKGWRDEEVARRWLWFFPGQGGTPGQPAKPEAIRSLCRDRQKLARCRQRLAALSWFMRCLNENIARRANDEDDCTGRFWEGRFKCEKLNDEGAALACMSYVDLNPVKLRILLNHPDEGDRFATSADLPVNATSRLVRGSAIASWLDLAVAMIPPQPRFQDASGNRTL